MYYEEFLPTAYRLTRKIIQRRDELIATIERAKKNLAAGQEDVVKFNSRLDALEKNSAESLTDDNLSFDKFRTAIKKLSADLDKSEKAVEMLEGKVIPGLQGELVATRRELNDALHRYFLQCKPTCEKRLRFKIDAVLQEKERFRAAFRQIYKAAGVGMDSHILPVKNKEIKILYAAFGVAPHIISGQSIAATKQAAFLDLNAGDVDAMTSKTAQETIKDVLKAARINPRHPYTDTNHDDHDKALRIMNLLEQKTKSAEGLNNDNCDTTSSIAAVKAVC